MAAMNLAKRSGATDAGMVIFMGIARDNFMLIVGSAQCMYLTMTVGGRSFWENRYYQ